MDDLDEFPHQDRDVVALFDVIGSFYVSTFYNSVYESAKALVNTNKSRSITEAYQSQVLSYSTFLKTNTDAFKTSLHNLYEFARKYNGRQMISTISSLIDRIAKTVVPDNLYENLTPSDKDELCNLVIIQLVSELASLFTSPDVLPMVIDRGNASQKQHVCKSLQIRGIRLLFNIRNDRLHTFISESTGSKGESVHQETISKQQRVIKEMAAEISSLEEKLIQARQQETKNETEKMRLLAIIYGLRQRNSQTFTTQTIPTIEPTQTIPTIEPMQTIPTIEPTQTIPTIEQENQTIPTIEQENQTSEETPTQDSTEYFAENKEQDDPFSAWN